MFSTASSTVTPSFVIVLTNGYKLQTTILKRRSVEQMQNSKHMKISSYKYGITYQCCRGTPDTSEVNTVRILTGRLESTTLQLHVEYSSH